MTVLLMILFFLIVVCAWVVLYDTHRFVTVKYRFASPKIKQGMRLVMLSDLHNYRYGRENELLLDAIGENKPDAVILAGDMITAKKGEKFDKTLSFLKTLAERYPVYYAYGNHEQKIMLYPGRYGDMGEKFEEGLKEAGIKPLNNLHCVLRDRNIVFYGLEIGREFFKRFEIPPMPEQYLTETLGTPESSAYCVLLAHNPDYFPEYAKWGADLVFSGHIHGGIVRLPFLGGVISPAIRFFPKYDGGLFGEGNAKMVLGRGIGTHSPRVRLFNPAELIVVELEKELDTERKSR